MVALPRVQACSSSAATRTPKQAPEMSQHVRGKPSLRHLSLPDYGRLGDYQQQVGDMVQILAIIWAIGLAARLSLDRIFDFVDRG